MWKIDWPAEIKESRACAGLARSMAENRLGHGLLLVADDSETADGAAVAVAEALLKNKTPHGDYCRVMPTNKQRQIGVEPMRELREFLQKSSLTGVKVAHISQADRLNISAANLFLKMLEEPPQDSYILMTTSEPYAVLPTLVSRAMRFRFDTLARKKSQTSIEEWCKSFEKVLKSGAGNSVMARMALADRALKIILAQEEEAETPSADDETPKDVVEALEAARLKEFKKDFFRALEGAALNSYKEAPTDSWKLRKALAEVERIYALTEFNLNTPAALEAAIGGVMEALS